MLCLSCSKEFEGESHFCSVECREKYYPKQRTFEDKLKEMKTWTASKLYIQDAEYEQQMLRDLT